MGIPNRTFQVANIGISLHRRWTVEWEIIQVPSIEIVCVGQEVPSEFSDLSFRVMAESKIISHRTPKPLFQSDFSEIHGCIYHLLNPIRGWTAFQLIDMNVRYNGADAQIERDPLVFASAISFLAIYRRDVLLLMRRLLNQSPIGQIIFTSDYQFGPVARRYKKSMPLDRFWDKHEQRRIRLNALYRVHQSPSSHVHDDTDT